MFFATISDLGGAPGMLTVISGKESDLNFYPAAIRTIAAGSIITPAIKVGITDPNWKCKFILWGISVSLASANCTLNGTIAQLTPYKRGTIF